MTRIEKLDRQTITNGFGRGGKKRKGKKRRRKKCS